MIIGIDLGTTNSLVSIWQNDKATLIPNVHGQLLTPSVVGLDTNGQIIVGEAAKERLVSHPQMTAANFKRYMGTHHEISLGGKSFRPEELSAFILKALKADAEAFLGHSIEEAIITVPAYFNDTQRKATKAAGQLAGLKVERLLNEPTAAALAYGIHKKDLDTKYMVFDLGGGTFDVSIVELFDGIIEVHASAGDNYLGGEDFKNQIVKSMLIEHQKALEIDPQNAPIALIERLGRQAELAKKALSTQDSAQLNLNWQNQSYQWTLTSKQFEALSEPLLDRLIQPVQRALRDAKLNVNDLDEIVLVGGATKMPIIRKLVTKLFARFPSLEVNPDEVVAVGAAIQGALKSRNAEINDVVMTDVCPYTLGIEIVRQLTETQVEKGFFNPIIERNSYVPVSREERFFTVEKDQRQLSIRIFQGENPRVQNNIFSVK